MMEIILIIITIFIEEPFLYIKANSLHSRNINITPRIPNLTPFFYRLIDSLILNNLSINAIFFLYQRLLCKPMSKYVIYNLLKVMYSLISRNISLLLEIQ